MAIPDTHANNAKLLSFLFALLALIVLLLAASKTTNTRTKDVENEDENGALLKRSDASALLKNVPENDDMRKKTYCTKVANVGEWFSAKPRANTHRWRWILRTLLMPVMRVMRQVVGGSSEGGEEREGNKRKRGSRTKG